MLNTCMRVFTYVFIDIHKHTFYYIYIKQNLFYFDFWLIFLIDFVRLISERHRKHTSHINFLKQHINKLFKHEMGSVGF